MARKGKYRCACGHSLAFHNRDDEQCHARVRVPETHVDEPDHVGSAPFNRIITYVDVDCRCQQYVGKTPKGYNLQPLV